jgi:hypothetical protein
MQVIKAFFILIIGFSLFVMVRAGEPLVAPPAPATISFDRPVPQEDGSELVRFPSSVQTEHIDFLWTLSDGFGPALLGRYGSEKRD